MYFKISPRGCFLRKKSFYCVGALITIHAILFKLNEGRVTRQRIDVIVPLLQRQYIFEVAVRGDDSLLNHDWYILP